MFSYARGFAPCIPGAESGRRGLNLRWRCPAGGLPSLSPADLTFSFFSCPYPPNPLPLRGRGSPRLFHARGFAPCIPGAEPERRGLNLRWRCPAGACPAGHRNRERTRAQRGHGGFARRIFLPYQSFSAPIPPPPFPSGEGGDFKFSYARGFAPCIPGAESGRRGLNLRWRYPAGGLPEWTPAGADVPLSGVIPDFPIPAEAAKPILQHPKSQPPCMLQDKSGTGHERRFQSEIYRESSWGLGGFFQEAPNVSPLPRFPVSLLYLFSLPMR